MGLTLVTAPTLEPITLMEAKAHLAIDSADHDGKLVGYILAARSWAEGFTHRALMTQTWDYTIDWNWPYVETDYCRTRIELPLPPVQSVTHIYYVDENGATQTLSPSDYVVRTDGPFGCIEQAYGVTWPTPRWQPYAITVRMVCGYGNNPGDVPEDLRHAMLLHIELLFDRDPNVAPLLERTRDSLISGNQAIRL